MKKDISRRIFLIRTAGFAITCGTATGVSARVFSKQSTEENIRAYLTSPEHSIAGIPLRHKTKLARIYSDRRFTPLWSKKGKFTTTCSAVLRKLESASVLGLHPSHYYTQILNNWLYLPNANSVTQMELVLTDSLLEYFDNLANGQTGKRPGNKSWFSKQVRTDIDQYALEFFRGDASFRETTDQLQPYNLRYRNLLEALKDHYLILEQGGFTRIAGGAALKPGHQDPRVGQLAARLLQSRDIDRYGTTNTNVYDWKIEDGVKLFQQRHGLEADGILGTKTLAELNVSVEQRISQIEVNLDRWRWLPNDLGASNIIVNTAGFEMDVTLDHNHALTMPVVVGKPSTRTPIFSDVMEHMVFNPAWHVPVSITRDILLPKERKKRGHLDSSNFVAVSLSNRSTRPVSSLSAKELETNNFISKYRLRQLPGKSNALGQVKFMLPNRYSIYLHDTNAKKLFNRTSRAFSHGCVRVENPQELARTLLRGDGVSQSEINAILDSENTRTVRLNEQLPVHITYQTSWVDDFGKVQFRPDIYDHDSHAIKNYRYQRPLQIQKETQLLARLGVMTAASEG